MTNEILWVIPCGHSVSQSKRNASCTAADRNVSRDTWRKERRLGDTELVQRRPVLIYWQCHPHATCSTHCCSFLSSHVAIVINIAKAA